MKPIHLFLIIATIIMFPQLLIAIYTIGWTFYAVSWLFFVNLDQITPILIVAALVGADIAIATRIIRRRLHHHYKPKRRRTEERVKEATNEENEIPMAMYPPE
jgi:hypothetical protein